MMQKTAKDNKIN